MLQADGISVVTVDRNRHAWLDAFSGIKYWGQPVEILCNLLYNAQCTISNDSAIAHLGGLLDVPTLCIMSQMGTDTTFAFTNVQTIVPDQSTNPCSPCFFLRKNGFRDACNRSCHALSTISVQAVYQKILGIIGDKG